MKFMLDIPLKRPNQLVDYRDKILVIGSCFTEHIGGRLKQLKFDVKQNPNGILFDPLSVASSLRSYINPIPYEKKDLVYLNELWHSWNHHSEFSGTDDRLILERINQGQQAAHDYLTTAGWLIITLGSSFIYKLDTGASVANCHRAPAQWFSKEMIPTNETIDSLEKSIHAVRAINPGIRIILTISPVRHIRDGVIENNRSKARLVEAVHQLVETLPDTYYFPAYEWVIDVLRDYRFFDIDLVHPNFAATQFVFEKFVEQFLNEQSAAMMKEIQPIVTAYNHKSFHPETIAHQQFLKGQLQRINAFSNKYPFVDLTAEEAFFSQQFSG